MPWAIASGPTSASTSLGILLLLLFAYALSWGFAFIGLSAPNSETAQLMSFPILFPLTFASSAFVPLQSMPGWLQAWARHQPVSIVVNAARDLMSGTPNPSLVFPPFTRIVSTGPTGSDGPVGGRLVARNPRRPCAGLGPPVPAASAVGRFAVSSLHIREPDIATTARVGRASPTTLGS